MSLSVVIPSRSFQNLIASAAAVRRHEPGARIVVVDDGVQVHGCQDARTLAELDLDFVAGEKPFVFARNCNRGIMAAREGLEVTPAEVRLGETLGPHALTRYPDVVLLNDDAVLETPGGFSTMRAAVDVHDFGLVSASTNVVASPYQYQTTSGGVRLARPYGLHSHPTVAFVCVLIPGRTFERVGLLDERFEAYGWEDVDFCRRVHDAGLKIAVDDRCFVDHGSLRSTFRGDPRAAGSIEPGKRIYLDKWGKL